MGKRIPAGSLKRDDMVDDVYAVRKRQSVVPYAKGFRFELEVGDYSGSILLKFWGGGDETRVRSLYTALPEGTVVRVRGRVGEYAGRADISIDDENAIQPVDPRSYDQDTFIAKSKRDIDQMWLELRNTMDSITDPTCKHVLAETFKDQVFIERYKHAVAAKAFHHAWIGGLIEHTLAIIGHCENACKNYPFVQRDLLITGAILHDIGKIDEYETTTTIQVTPIMTLVGHLSLETGRILSFRGKAGIDENTILKLAHIVLSHHGKYEFGSPKLPAIPEAVILSGIDEIDARVERMRQVREEAEEGKFEFFDKKDERSIYLK